MLAQALVSQPDLLLLDEPTNHLDIESIEALETAVLEYPGAVVFVTHDRSFIDRLATRIVELDRGRLRSLPGRYASYLQRKAELLEAEAAADRKFDQELAREEVWIRQGIKARRTRNEGRVRRLEAMRRERAARRERTGKVGMTLSGGDRSGKLVVEVVDATFAYDGRPVITGFSTRIQRGDRIGIIGRNGSGKTTLLKGLLGRIEPAAGSVTLGTQLNIAYFDQERQQLDEERSVRDNLAEGSDHIEVDGRSRHVIGYLADFLFPPARAQSPVKALSGGERNRLLLAKLFARSANLLVLDEPTNDLDVETLELLEDLLSEYPGTLLLVSHDRSFIDRTVTSTMVLDGSGRVEEHVGGYSDWMRYREALVNDTESRPQRRTESAKKARGAASPSKLSYKEQRELDALPGLIESLEQRHSEMQRRTAEPDFYHQPKEVIAAAMTELADNESALQEAYARWEEIEARSGS
jgi:ATP-binding cassette subfamily F protein uup